MKTILTGMTACFALTVALVVADMVAADELGKTGTGTLHSGWKSTGTVTQVSEKHLYWAGTWSAISFNDEGRGFLHKAAWTCPALSDINNGIASIRGFCVLTDSQGDKIHGSWSNQGPLNGEIIGRFEITDGTGKYSGIKGGWEIGCIVLTADSATCRQKYSYKLP
jgi:hypothetical protein